MRVLMLIAAVAALGLGGATSVVAGPGGWAIVSSPDATTITNELTGVACTSATFCMAAGTFGDETSTGGLIEQWDGGVWSAARAPVSAANVACTSSAFCATVGPEGLIWDGLDWSVTPIPAAPDPEHGPMPVGFADISCASPAFCAAVGGYQTDTVSPDSVHTTTEIWDGTEWSFVPSPPLGVNAFLGGVSCSSATFCMSVGARYGGGTFSEVWNGASWTLIPTVDVASPAASFLIGVACTSPTFCVAVGDSFVDQLVHPDLPGGARTLVEVWDGSTWSIVSSEDGGTINDNNALQDVSCTSPKDCTAVGSWGVPSRFERGATFTVIEHWNGHKWRLIAGSDGFSPRVNPPPLGNELHAISCIESGCVAAGDSFWADPTDTLLSKTLTLADGTFRH